MTLTQIIVFAFISVVLALVKPEKSRINLLVILSVLAVFWLQPSLPIRYLSFWLSIATLTLTVISWILVASGTEIIQKEDLQTAVILFIIAFLLGLTRYFPVDLGNIFPRPPQVMQLLVGLMVISSIVFLASRFWRPYLLTAMIVLIIALLVIIKTPSLIQKVGLFLRTINGQAVTTASVFDVRWFGFSYIAFRLIHTIRDRQAGRLSSVSLAEYVTYVVFFPSLTAGPIDRIERFVGDLRQPFSLTQDDWTKSGQRFFVGLFKKFVIADSLALIVLNERNALQVNSTFYAWILLYAFAFQIYFDFSGYTDIVIGIAHLLGIKLPENFNAPYLKSNLTLFWNNWHMTLTQWFRSYYFNPLTRWLRGLANPLPVPALIFITQVSTMVLIGLWHGVTWNFVLWGLWQGLGLFFHNRWNDFLRPHLAFFSKSPARIKITEVGGIIITFNYVALGWVFFALPTPALSYNYFLKLFGIAA
jgi:alginate O-acetyltransferase complex protein AlgI